MAIISEDDCRTIMKKALSYSKADECEISFSGSDSGNIRYARNSVSTSGFISQTNMVISSAYGKKLGIVTTNEYDDASIEKAVRLAETLAQFAPENPEFVSFLGPQTYSPPAKTFDADTAAITPAMRTDKVSESLQ